MNARSSCMLLLLGAVATIVTAQESSEAELAAKTDALMNLPRYVEWPDGAFVVERTPLMVGVYGRSKKMHKHMLATADGKVLNGRRVLVRRYYWPQIPNCHLLFIAGSERHRLPGIIRKIEHSATLTVAEFDDFLTHGGILRLSTKDDKLRFHVNNTAATGVGLRFSSQFLGVADEVVFLKTESRPR